MNLRFFFFFLTVFIQNVFHKEKKTEKLEISLIIKVHLKIINLRNLN